MTRTWTTWLFVCAAAATPRGAAVADELAAPAPDVTVGAIVVAHPEGKLDAPALRRSIEAELPAVRACYEKRLEKRPGLEGDVLAFLAVQGSGKVKATVGGLGDATVEKCVSTALARVSVTAPGKPGAATVSIVLALPRELGGLYGGSPDEPRGGGTGTGVVVTSTEAGDRKGRSVMIRRPTAAEGGLDKDAVHAIIRGRTEEIRSCYETELAKRDFEARLKVEFAIRLDGSVAEVKVSGTERGALQSCVKGVFEKMEFPRRDAGELVRVSYPIVFEASK